MSSLSHHPEGQEPLGNDAEPQRAADLIVDVLIRHGVDVVFGLPGGAISPVHDALMRRPEVRMVTFRHESGAAFAAAGYARVTGKLGVVVVTAGPGATNTLTGVTSAQLEGLPMLVLAGDAPRAQLTRGAAQDGSRQGIDLVSIAKPVTKLAAEVIDPSMVESVVTRAIATALSGKMGAVLLTLPLDISSAKIVPQRIVGDVRVTVNLDEEAIAFAARALETAERPLILAGSGARWGGAPQRLIDLAERLQIPVATTPKGKGVFPISHPLSLGVWGWAGHKTATSYVESGVDTLIVVGSSLAEISSNSWSTALRPSKNLIQIDIDASIIGRNYRVSRGIVGYAADALRAITSKVTAPVPPAKQFVPTYHTDPMSLRHGSEGRITPQRALWELQRSFSREAMYSCDIGEHMLYGIHYLKTHDPNGFVIMLGLASMGSGIGASIGMHLGQPERPVVAICGDGCFAMGLSDIATIGHERLPVLIAVLDDERYGMVEIGHEAVYGTRPLYPMTFDIVNVAKGLGIDGSVVTRADEILTLDLNEKLRHGPYVLDIKIDRTVRMPRNPRNDFISQAARSKSTN